MMTVKKLLQKKGSQIWSVIPEATVHNAVNLMAEKNIGALLVMEGEKVVGILSERDCVRRVMLRGKKSRETLVREVMTPSVIYALPEYTLQACMTSMTENHIRHLPVIVNGKAVGLITLGDVVKEIISSQETTIQRLEDLVTGVEYDH